jgi:hypothetical protein
MGRLQAMKCSTDMEYHKEFIDKISTVLYSFEFNSFFFITLSF